VDLITVRAAGSGATVSVRAHRLESDHAPADGGSDAGPSPAELFVASLGTCMALAVATYCHSHGYGDGVEVDLTYTMAKAPTRIASVVVDIRVPAGFPADRIEAVRRVAELCPLHATLARPPQVDVEIVLS
jgi:putative redox protein